jgi:predicted component of type VI protein secretion system
VAFYEKLSKQEPGSFSLSDSVARNLEALLNAKEGYSASVAVFGIGSYDGHYAHRKLVDVLIGEMLQKVRVFEPRVKDPALFLVGRYRALWVLFRLTGRCDDTSCSFEIFFHSIFRNVRVVPS